MKRTATSKRGVWARRLGLATLAAVAVGALCMVGIDLAGVSPQAEARFARGAAVGGYRVGATTSVRVTRPATLPAYNVGRVATTAGVSRRVARRTTRRVLYRHYGAWSGYYYADPVYVLPGGCYTVILNGMAAYNCSGVYYFKDTLNGTIAYYQIQ